MNHVELLGIAIGLLLLAVAAVSRMPKPRVDAQDVDPTCHNCGCTNPGGDMCRQCGAMWEEPT